MTERFQDGAQSLPKLLARKIVVTDLNEVSVLFSQTCVLVMAMGTTLLRGKGGNLNDMQIQDEFIARDN